MYNNPRVRLGCRVFFKMAASMDECSAHLRTIVECLCCVFDLKTQLSMSKFHLFLVMADKK